MTGVDERLQKFEAWAEAHGSDVRAPERRRVAEELLEIAGDEAILELDVETLVRRYKQELQGAQRIMLASRVGREMLDWQEQEISKSVRGAALAGDSERPAPDDAAESKRVVPGPRIATWRRQSIDELEDKQAAAARAGLAAEPPAREQAFELEDERLSPAPASSDARVIFGPKGRRRFDSEGDTSGGIDVDAVAGAIEDPRAPGRSMRPSDLEEFRARYRSIEQGSSAPPPMRESQPEQLDVEVAGIKPRVRGSDAPPPNHAPVSLERDSPSQGPPASARPSPASLYPVGNASVGRTIEDERDRSWRERLGLTGGLARPLALALLVLLALAAIAVVVTRPSWLFRDPAKPVTGKFASKHLGLAMTFPGSWLQAEDLDDEGKTKDGYTRKISVFYQGTSASDFASKIEIVTLEKDGAPATQDTARTLGAGETLDAAERRQCTAFVHGTSHGTACTAIAPGLGNPTPSWMIEEYFDLGGRVVFVRGRVKASSAAAGDPGLAPPPLPGAATSGPIATSPVAEGTRELADRMTELTEVLDSIDLPPAG
jgi:hypothetical protein